MKKITSFSNLIIKDLIKLKKPGERKNRSLIIIDGYREIDLALKNGLDLLNLFFCPDLIRIKKNKEKNIIPWQLENNKQIEVSKKIFNKISYKNKPDGFLALVKAKNRELKEVKIKNDSLILVLENVEKPGNIGAILRTAAASGVDFIIINDNQTDIYNQNIIRASEGQIFTQKIIQSTFLESFKWLRKNKVKTFGAATSASKIYTESNLKGRIAIIVGSEARGLSMDCLEKVDELIKIPMLKDIDSLNVSVATAIILFEALRQRKLLK